MACITEVLRQARQHPIHGAKWLALGYTLGALNRKYPWANLQHSQPHHRLSAMRKPPGRTHYKQSVPTLSCPNAPDMKGGTHVQKAVCAGRAC